MTSAINEVFPLERVNDAYDRMLTGKAQFRVVLTMGSVGSAALEFRQSFSAR